MELRDDVSGRLLGKLDAHVSGTATCTLLEREHGHAVLKVWLSSCDDTPDLSFIFTPEASGGQDITTWLGRVGATPLGLMKHVAPNAKLTIDTVLISLTESTKLAVGLATDAARATVDRVIASSTDFGCNGATLVLKIGCELPAAKPVPRVEPEPGVTHSQAYQRLGSLPQYSFRALAAFVRTLLPEQDTTTTSIISARSKSASGVGIATLVDSLASRYEIRVVRHRDGCWFTDTRHDVGSAVYGRDRRETFRACDPVIRATASVEIHVEVALGPPPVVVAAAAPSSADAVVASEVTTTFKDICVSLGRDMARFVLDGEASEQLLQFAAEVNKARVPYTFRILLEALYTDDIRLRGALLARFAVLV